MGIKPNKNTAFKDIRLRNTIRLFLAILTIVGIRTALGADFWEKKDFTEWSKNECRKLLTDSPWARQYTQSKTLIAENTPENMGRYGDGVQSVTYLIQLYSALPIRQAIVRQMQIAQNYEKLPLEQRKQLDEKANSFLTANYNDVVVLNVSYMTNVQEYDFALAQYWQIKTADFLKSSTYLKGSKGDRVPLANYAVARGAQRSFQFIFPRIYKGSEILGPEDKNLQLEFVYPVVGNIGNGTGFMEFKTKKMRFKGKLEY